METVISNEAVVVSVAGSAYADILSHAKTQRIPDYLTEDDTSHFIGYY